MFHKAGVGGETVLLPVFQHKQPVGLQQLAAEDEVRKGREPFQGVWGVGEDEVELFAALAKVAE